MLAEGMADLPSMVAVLQAQGFDGSLGTIVRIAGDDRCVDSLGASFDLILAIAVAEYVDDTVTLLTRLAQRLDHGGTLLITVPNRTSPVRVVERIIRPLLARGRAVTGRLADQSYTELRPHGDDVTWQRAAAAAGLVIKQMRTVPFGLSGVQRWFHPNLLISLDRMENHRD
jgi:SAM-dependent methyltransferase